jgi:hypothetical protein
MWRPRGQRDKLIERGFAAHRPTRKCLVAVGPNHNLLRAHALATGQDNGPRREHDSSMEERRGGNGDTSSVPGV